MDAAALMKNKKIEEAWNLFFESNQTTTVEAMNAEGWKTAEQVAKESGLSLSRVSGIINEGHFERVKKRIHFKGKTREINFVRPKI